MACSLALTRPTASITSSATPKHLKRPLVPNDFCVVRRPVANVDKEQSDGN